MSKEHSDYIKTQLNSTTQVLKSIASLPNILAKVNTRSEDLSLQLTQLAMLGNGLFELTQLFIISIADNDLDKEEPQLLMKAIHKAEVEINRKMSELLLTIKNRS